VPVLFRKLQDRVIGDLLRAGSKANELPGRGNAKVEMVEIY
jgi:hypothetical protein